MDIISTLTRKISVADPDPFHFGLPDPDYALK